MRWLYYYLGGYLDVCLGGFSPERFLNLCMARQIRIWNLRFQDGMHFFYIPLMDFYKLRPLARKAKVRLRIKGRYGLPFFYTGTGNGNCLRQAWRDFFWCFL